MQMRRGGTQKTIEAWLRLHAALHLELVPPLAGGSLPLQDPVPHAATSASAPRHGEAPTGGVHLPLHADDSRRRCAAAATSGCVHPQSPTAAARHLAAWTATTLRRRAVSNAAHPLAVAATGPGAARPLAAECRPAGRPAGRPHAAVAAADLQALASRHAAPAAPDPLAALARTAPAPAAPATQVTVEVAAQVAAAGAHSQGARTPPHPRTSPRRLCLDRPPHRSRRHCPRHHHGRSQQRQDLY
jgi:DNA polymerase III subunit gamma/tau